MVPTLSNYNYKLQLYNYKLQRQSNYPENYIGKVGAALVKK
jgi:hypothetical protein